MRKLTMQEFLGIQFVGNFKKMGNWISYYGDGSSRAYTEWKATLRSPCGLKITFVTCGTENNPGLIHRHHSELKYTGFELVSDDGKSMPTYFLLEEHFSERIR